MPLFGLFLFVDWRGEGRPPPQLSISCPAPSAAPRSALVQASGGKPVVVTAAVGLTEGDVKVDAGFKVENGDVRLRAGVQGGGKTNSWGLNVDTPSRNKKGSWRVTLNTGNWRHRTARFGPTLHEGVWSIKEPPLKTHMCCSGRALQNLCIMFVNCYDWRPAILSDKGYEITHHRVSSTPTQALHVSCLCGNLTRQFSPPFRHCHCHRRFYPAKIKICIEESHSRSKYRGRFYFAGCRS